MSYPANRQINRHKNTQRQKHNLLGVCKYCAVVPFRGVFVSARIRRKMSCQISPQGAADPAGDTTLGGWGGGALSTDQAQTAPQSHRVSNNVTSACGGDGVNTAATTTIQLRFYGRSTAYRRSLRSQRRNPPAASVTLTRLGYCDDASRTFNSICADADERMFTCTFITSNRRHLLHPFLPPQQEQHYLLRKRSHGYKLPEHTHPVSMTAIF